MVQLLSEQIEVADELESIQRLYLERGWSDGLPIVPPTPERVAAMVEAVNLDPQQVVAEIPPQYGAATVERIATNAVMAGCLPEYLPILVAALEAMNDPAFNFYGIQATTHPCAPLLIINGPIRAALGFHSYSGAYGPGWRPNATIGRALRLVMLNIGAATPEWATCPPRARPPSTPTAWPKTRRRTPGSRCTCSAGSALTRAP